MTGKIFYNTDGENTNNLWLAFFRCSVSALTLVNFLAIQFDFNNMFSATAFIPPDITDVLKNPLIPSIYGIYQFLKPVFNFSYAGVLLTIRILYPLALLFLFTGFYTRISALMSLVLQLIILNSMDFYTYGLDEFTTITLFYCLIFPVGCRLSLDNYFFRRNNQSVDHTRYLWLLRMHICIAYFFSGFEKLLGYNWRNGESIWKMIHGYNMLSFINLDALYRTPVFLVAGWMTIVLETLYPIFMNNDKTRATWLCGVLAFHIGIAFFMGLYFFSSIMIFLNLSAYYIPFMVIEERPVAVKRSLSTT
jgi:hypothetical protein